MVDDSRPPARPRPYHHGDLREALLAASFELLAADGPEAFSVAGVARAVGVSTAAPYRHFNSRDDLLAAVATRAAALMRADLESALVAAGPDPGARFAAATAVYVRFTVTRGAGVQVVFAPDLPDPSGTLRQASQALVELMLGVAEDACRAPGGVATGLLGAQLALAHGFATLFRQRYYAGNGGGLDGVVERAARAGSMLLSGVVSPPH